MKKYIKVFAPASVSNIACGFDIMGFAIEKPGDEVELLINDSGEIKITEITGDNGKLPKEIEKNTATVALKAMYDFLKLDCGIDIKIHKKMALGSGLGSSAASAVASVFALNNLLDNQLPIEKILDFALEGEKLASGSIHADNVAPCLYGGLVLIRGYDPLEIIPMHVPVDLYCSVLHSDVEIRTIEARKILPQSVPLNKAITQWGNVGGLVAGFLKGDYGLIERSMKDVIIEPVRSKLIPGYDRIKDAALKAGAIGCNISGSGPSVFALSKSKEEALIIAKEMAKVVSSLNIDNTFYISKVNGNAPRVLEVQ